MDIERETDFYNLDAIKAIKKMLGLTKNNCFVIFI